MVKIFWKFFEAYKEVRQVADTYTTLDMTFVKLLTRNHVKVYMLYKCGCFFVSNTFTSKTRLKLAKS